MHNPWGEFYPNEDGCHIALPGYVLEYAEKQGRDNAEALFRRLKNIAHQTADMPELRNDLVATLVESFVVPVAILAEAFDLDGQRGVMEIREAEPISLFSCFHPRCQTPLHVRNPKHLWKLSRATRILRKAQEGDLVKVELISEVLCECCAQGVQYAHEQQLRAERLARKARQKELNSMSYAEYLKTKEWKARRNRALLRAGNKCVPCGRSDVPLEVHHNCYERRGSELLEDLVVLCRRCHQLYHGVLPDAA